MDMIKVDGKEYPPNFIQEDFEGDFDEEDWEDEDFFEEDEIIIRGKWSMEGAETLTEAADLLRAYAEELDRLAETYSLREPIRDDYGFLEKRYDIDNEDSE